MKHRAIELTLNTILSWSMKLCLVGFLIFGIVTQIEGLIIFSTIIALICTFLPPILNRRYDVNLPWLLDFAVTLTVFLHTTGLAFNFYHSGPLAPWWDIMTHFLGSAVIGMVAFFVVFTLHYVNKVNMSIPMIGFFTFVFALAIGALWEILEFYSDVYLGTIAAINQADTILDLVVDSLGGGAAAIFGMLYVLRRRRTHLSKTIRPIATILIGSQKNTSPD